MHAHDLLYECYSLMLETAGETTFIGTMLTYASAEYVMDKLRYQMIETARIQIIGNAKLDDRKAGVLLRRERGMIRIPSGPRLIGVPKTPKPNGTVVTFKPRT